MQSTIPLKLAKRVHPIPQREYRQPAARKLTGAKKGQVLKYRKQIHALSLVRTTWKERRRILSTKKGLSLIHQISPFVVNHLS